MITALASPGSKTRVVGDGADEIGPFSDNRLYIIESVVSNYSNNDYRVRGIDADPRRWIIHMPGQFSVDEIRSFPSNATYDGNFDSPVGTCWVYLEAGNIQSFDGGSRTMTWNNYREITGITEEIARKIIANLS
jgi:hypothetical protein